MSPAEYAEAVHHVYNGLSVAAIAGGALLTLTSWWDWTKH